MAKRRLSLKIRIPAYKSNRNLWKHSIHDATLKEVTRKGIEYHPEDKLEVIIKMYLNRNKLLISDVDNWAKNFLDALQGRVGGPKKVRKLQPIIPNDKQIYKVTIEKLLPPKQSHGLGHLVVRKYRDFNKSQSSRKG